MSLLNPEILDRLDNYNTTDSLIYGIGNIGRQDDGLGWAFLDWLEKESIFPKAELMRHYQLHLEDADLISRKKNVLFVDASKAPHLKKFSIENVVPKLDFTFTSHAMSVETVLAICKLCYENVPKVQFLTIKGYEWELQQGLTKNATKNLQEVITYFKHIKVRS